MPRYKHRDGSVEVTVPGGVRDRQLARRAADGRTKTHLVTDEQPDETPAPDPTEG